MVQPSDNGSRVPERHPTLARHFDELFAAELERIARVRENKAARYATDRDTTGTAGREEGAPRDRPLAGLALSGGGIRSAAFGLGVLQALANEGLLRRFDYLSTVSGGGYIGSALTWFLSEVWRRPDGTRFGTGEDDHPLGRRGIGAKTGTENDRIDHIRGFGNYLRPTPELWTGSAAALVLQSMAYVVMLWFFPLVFLLLVSDRLVWLVRYAADLPDPGLGQNLAWLWLGTALATLLALLRVAWLPRGLRRFFDAARPRDPAGYPSRLARQNSLGKWLVLGFGSALVAVLPGLGHLAPKFAAGGLTLGGLVATLSTVTGFVASRPVLKEVALRVGVVLLAVGLLVAAVALPEWLAGWLDEAGLGIGRGWARWIVVLGFAVAAAAALFASLRAMLNYHGLHRLYRDRLMETFLPDRPPGADHGGSDRPGLGRWRPAIAADAKPLAEVCDPESLGPYHLIGTNAILVGSRNSVVRNRGGESFLLSPLYSGCDQTGWRATDRLFAKAQLQLSTAMAISGAAVSPNTASAGRGLGRSPAISRLMMLFNLRLAYWLPNPRPEEEAPPNRWLQGLIRRADRMLDKGDRGEEYDRPRFAYPGFAALLGITHAETSAYLELSDGGHFENLGLYELVRRRVPLIVVADGGMDPTFAFADLANAIERVRVDFGVDVVFDREGFGLGELQAGRDRLVCVGGRHVEVAERGWAVARVRYPETPPAGAAGVVPTAGAGEGSAIPFTREAHEGVLVYLKPAMRAGLRADIMAYRAANPAFPHETTADQFFDEGQFEAYRELGYQTGQEFLARSREETPGSRLDGLLEGAR